MLKRIFAISLKEIIYIKRIKVVWRIPLIMPIVWLFILSRAFIITPTNLQLDVVDKINTQESITIVDALGENKNLILDSKNEYESGRNAIIFENNIVTLILNDADFYNARALEVEVKKTISTWLNSLETEYLYDVEKNPNIFIIPGIIALVLQNVLVFLSSISIVREKEKGTFQQLQFSPANSFEIITGKLLPYFFIGVINLIMLMILSAIFYDINFMNISLYLFAGLMYIMSSLLFGLLISSIAKSQMHALLYTVFLLLPSILVSNFIFPVNSMPGFLQIFSKLIPITHFNNASRLIIIEQGDIATILLPLLFMLAIIVVTAFLAITSINFKKHVL